MSTKKIFSCIIAAFIINVFSSFNVHSLPKSEIQQLYPIKYLKQTVVVSGITFNIYLIYDVGQEAVIGALVYSSDCISYTVTEVTSYAIMVNTSGTNWYAGNQIYITTLNYGTFMVSGDFVEEDPDC